MKRLIALPLVALAAACTTTPAPFAAAGSTVEIPDGVHVGKLVAVPQVLLEDSRCPMNARCVWAGRVRLSVRIDLGARSETREIASDAPIQVADGQLALVEVQPDRVAGGQPASPKPYRFGFTFAGGL